jgi:hypothetical protein
LGNLPSAFFEHGRTMSWFCSISFVTVSLVQFVVLQLHFYYIFSWYSRGFSQGLQLRFCLSETEL